MFPAFLERISFIFLIFSELFANFQIYIIYPQPSAFHFLFFHAEPVKFQQSTGKCAFLVICCYPSYFLQIHMI